MANTQTVNGYVINLPGRPAPWGPVERQLHLDIVQYLPVNGSPVIESEHVHYRLFDSAQSEHLRLDLSEAIFNEDGLDYDFRFEGDTDANLLFLDASTDRVGVGTNAPASKLDVNGVITATGGDSDDWNIAFSSIYWARNSGTGKLYLVNLTDSVGIGVAAPSARLHVTDATINSTSTYYGIITNFGKTAGATDASDHLYGEYNQVSINHNGSTNGALVGEFKRTYLIDGNLGDGGTPRGLISLWLDAIQDAGQIFQNMTNLYVVTTQSGGTVSGSVHGINVEVNITGAVTGTVYCLYLNEVAGVDYGIYQSGTAPNYLGGDLTVGKRLLQTQGANVASANDITLGDGNLFDVTGTTTINRILTTGWTAGTIVVLRFTDASGLSVDPGVAAGGGYASIRIFNSSDPIAFNQYGTITLIYDGTLWDAIAYNTNPA